MRKRIRVAGILPRGDLTSVVVVVAVVMTTMREEEAEVTSLPVLEEGEVEGEGEKGKGKEALLGRRSACMFSQQIEE
jgi:hypothetical protein